MNSIQTVLIIDDDEDDILLIEDRISELSSTSVEFVSCDDKIKAVAFLKERTFDLCVLDYRLAGFSGTDILEAVDDADLATPIVMLTGQNDDEIAKQAIKLGAQDFVMKSLISKNEFEKSIKYAVARKELAFAKMLSQRNEAENVAKDKFIAHLSHELRTPLTSILGYTSLLLEDQNTESFSKELGIISKNGKHLLNLLNDVLDLSKIAAGKFELREKETDMQQMLSEVSSLVAVNAIDKGLFINFYNINKLPSSLIVDALRFKQVLLNLIGNAIKFSDSGGVTVSFEFIANRSELVIKVLDTGIGMKVGEIKEIFSPFKQIEDVADRKAGGAGLGLSISAEIVKQMNGKLEVVSDLGKGSEFTLTLPCQASTTELINLSFDFKQEQTRQINTPNLLGNILVVDDLFEIRQLAGFYLKQSGLQVDYAKNGKDTVEILAATKQYDCVLMDLHMPVMTGKEAMVHIKKILPQLPVIAMTAAIAKDLKKDLVDIGFVDLIAKPIDKKELWDAVSLYVNNAHHEDLNGINKDKQTAQGSKNQTEKYVHLVEDDVDSAEVMKMMIEQLGYGIIHSATGAEAIANMDDFRISIHLVDLGLPDLQSEALIRELTNTNYAGDIYILSGQQPNQSLLEQFSITEHLIKPINMDDLREILC